MMPKVASRLVRVDEMTCATWERMKAALNEAAGAFMVLNSFPIPLMLLHDTKAGKAAALKVLADHPLTNSRTQIAHNYIVKNDVLYHELTWSEAS